MSKYFLFVVTLLIGTAPLQAESKPCRSNLQFVAAFDPWSPSPFRALGVDSRTREEVVRTQHQIARDLFSKLAEEADKPYLEKSFLEAVTNIDQAWRRWQELHSSLNTDFTSDEVDERETGARDIDPLDAEIWMTLRRDAETADAWFDDGSSVLYSKLIAHADALNVRHYSKEVNGRIQHLIVISELPENPIRPAQAGLTVAAGFELVERSPFSVAAYPISSGGGGKAYEAFALQNFLLQKKYDGFVGIKGNSEKAQLLNNWVPNTIAIADLILRIGPPIIVMVLLGREFIPDGVNKAEGDGPLIWAFSSYLFIWLWTKVPFPTMHSSDYLPTGVTSEEHRRRGSVVDRGLRAFQRWRLVRRIKQFSREDILSEEQPLAVFVDHLQAKYLHEALLRQGFSEIPKNN